MNENTMLSFSEQEKAQLTRRLRAAARTARRPARRHVRRMICVAAAAALLVAGAAAAGQAVSGRYMAVEGQRVAADAVMTLNGDGSATIAVQSVGGDTTIVAAPPATASALLDGSSSEFAGEYVFDGPYQLAEQRGRLILRVKGRVALDVSDLIADGYTFGYAGEDGVQHTVTVSGTVSQYTVQ